MDEKRLIVYLKVDEIISLTLTLFFDTSRWLLSLLWWPPIFHFTSVTSLLRHCHLQHACSFPSLLLHSTRFIQCWSVRPKPPPLCVVIRVRVQGSHLLQPSTLVHTPPSRASVKSTKQCLAFFYSSHTKPRVFKNTLGPNTQGNQTTTLACSHSHVSLPQSP